MKNQEMIEYNRRQVDLMEQKIAMYRKNDITMKHFISSILALASFIKDHPEDWYDYMNTLCNRIELIYIYAADDGIELTDEDYKNISRNVDEIEKNVDWYKNNYLSSIDDENLEI